MITYKREEIKINGQYIAYWSKQKEIPRLRSLEILDQII
jgi:hypothetical protein